MDGMSLEMLGEMGSMSHWDKKWIYNDYMVAT